MPGAGETRGGDDALATGVADEAPPEEGVAGASLSALGSAIESTAEGSSGVLVSSYDRGAAFDAADVDDAEADAAASAPPARTTPTTTSAAASFDGRGEAAPTVIDTGTDAVTGIDAIDAFDDAP